MDELLNRYKEINDNYSNYKIELTSIRAEIEGVLERSGETTYNTNEYKVTLKNESVKKSISISSLNNAIELVNLDEEQKEQILRHAILTKSSQAHIQIKEIS